MGGYKTGDIVGISDLKDRSLWKAAVAEALGTFLLVFVAVGSCLEGSPLSIALTFGLTVASIAQAIGHVSGCHINPAVSLGLVAAGKMGVIKMGIYIGCQCGGALVGSVLLFVVLPPTPEKHSADYLGKSVPNPHLAEQAFVRYIKAVIIELIITMVLVLTVLGATDENRTDVKGSAPLAIGLSITACHLFAIPLTGSSMNPARSFGPLLVYFDSNFDLGYFWVYWLGPLAGGAAAGVLYEFVFKAPGPAVMTAPTITMAPAAIAPSYISNNPNPYKPEEEPSTTEVA